MLKLMCLKELMLAKPLICPSVLFAITGNFFRWIWDFSQKCDWCYNLMQKAMTFIDVEIASVERNDYRTNFWYMSKDESINLLKVLL